MNRTRDALHRWREAERALAATRPGTRAARAALAELELARDAYQQLVDGEVDVEGHQMPAHGESETARGRHPD